MHGALLAGVLCAHAVLPLVASRDTTGQHVSRHESWSLLQWSTRTGEVQLESHGATGCNASVPKESRILLLTLAQAGHGSTALLEVLMSSPKVSSLCRGKSWQCEGFQLARVGTCGIDPNSARPCQTKLLESMDIFESFSKHWDLKRPVLHDKLFPDEVPYTTAVSRSISTANLLMTGKFAAAGITKLKPVYVLMWTPFCVRKLSSRPFLPRYGKSGIESEVSTLQQLQLQHSALISSGVPVVVISYADLLWRPHETVSRLERFLPCVGALDIDYIPSHGKDVFVENGWKVNGSVHAFGAKHNAMECCGFSSLDHVCKDDTLFKQLGPLEDEMRQLHEYFRRYSFDEF